MKWAALFLVMAMLAFSHHAQAQLTPAEFAEFKRGLPNDVAAFVDRNLGCNHWRGEEGDPGSDRAKEIDQAIADLACGDRQKDELALRAKYSDAKRVLDALTTSDSLGY